jgi:hypothetical protein
VKRNGEEKKERKRKRERESETHKGRSSTYDKALSEKYAYVALDHDLIYRRQAVQEKA